MPDPWDIAGAVGLGLVLAGVVALRGWPWGSILLGLVLLVVYLVRELGLARSARP